jgi:phosphoribosylglycinamide formyltransferase 2
MSDAALSTAKDYAAQVTNALGGWGLFGVEFFIKQDQVYFSELSPRPHDTGMVTMISQHLSEFALHARAVLGLPVPAIIPNTPAASHVVLVRGHSHQVIFGDLELVLKEDGTDLRLFGKPEVNGERRMGVVLARDTDVSQARAKAGRAAKAISVRLE